MDPKKLSDIVRRAGHGLKASGTTQAVIVDLNAQQADPETLDHLKKVGLAIDKVLQNKVIGSIDSDQLEALRADKAVRAVEVSVPLRPHSE